MTEIKYNASGSLGGSYEGDVSISGIISSPLTERLAKGRACITQYERARTVTVTGEEQ
jgi:hypothetical protein